MPNTKDIEFIKFPEIVNVVNIKYLLNEKQELIDMRRSITKMVKNLINKNEYKNHVTGLYRLGVLILDKDKISYNTLSVIYKELNERGFLITFRIGNIYDIARIPNNITILFLLLNLSFSLFIKCLKTKNKMYKVPK